MTLKSFPVVGLTKGLQTNVKPAMLPDNAWQIMENAYTFRERELKREGRKLLGRLRRVLTNQAQANTNGTASYQITDILSGFRANEPHAELEPTSFFLTVSFGNPDQTVYTDLTGNGVLTKTMGPYSISKGYVNYVTGKVVLAFSVSPGAGIAVQANFNYFPTLPVMGIPTRDISAINAEQTIWFDEIYAYIWNGTGFQEFIPGTTWASTDSDFFSWFNYRSANASQRILFVTNFVSTAANPIRYTDGTTWTSFVPLVTATDSIFQARIIVAYYGRLLLLNTWEGTTAGGAGLASNFFNRCRFSQLGDPTAVDAFRTDQFGKGGSLDAPTNEAITGATFIKNTLVVDFERTTWQLRYVGEYGQPFIWERISADFGSESTFSGVLFDNHRLSIGDKAITTANAGGVDRIDLDIPDTIFNFKNANNGVKRVFGIRDYQRELVFWNFADAQTEVANGVDIIFPNKVLVYNYRNNSWSIFRDSITAFGTFQSNSNITWDSLNVFWDDDTVFWDDFDTQSLFPIIVCGDQQGFVSCYGYPSPSNISTVPAIDQETLTIQNISEVIGLLQLTSADHNLQSSEIVYISGLNFIDSTTFLPVSNSINDKIYQVQVIDENTVSLGQWNTLSQSYEYNFSYTPDLSTVIYVGGGKITLFPKYNIISKDINIFQGKSLQTKLSRLDFLFQPVTAGEVTINLWLNATVIGSAPDVTSNSPVVSKPLSIDAIAPFYTQGSDYSWFRLYATLAAQYFNIQITYNDDQMNTLTTHSNACTLYAINAWCREGGKIVF